MLTSPRLGTRQRPVLAWPLSGQSCRGPDLLTALAWATLMCGADSPPDCSSTDTVKLARGVWERGAATQLQLELSFLRDYCEAFPGAGVRERLSVAML